ncbi:hypothetical protein H0H92_014202 [Tricholoma furcatifolium]|nr:hypothetical protein H0H92_014202 [Tricholoma furcatifolium]
MEEAAFQTPSSSGGIQISGQTIRLESVGLETAGECKLTPESWIECSMNLVHAIAEHLLAGTDGRCGGPTARVIAGRFEQHFTNLCSKADFISHFRIYLEYDIRMRSCWVTLSHDMDIAVWQPHIMEGLVLADVHCTSDAMISTLSNFMNNSNTSQSNSSSSRGRSNQQTSFCEPNRDRSTNASSSNKTTPAAKAAAIIFCMLCGAGGYFFKKCTNSPHVPPQRRIDLAVPQQQNNLAAAHVPPAPTSTSVHSAEAENMGRKRVLSSLGLRASVKWKACL